MQAVEDHGFIILTPSLQQNRVGFHDFDSQPSQVSVDSQQPVSNQSQPNQDSGRPNSQIRNSQPRSRSGSQSDKTPLQRYMETKPLSCAEANASRMVSSRRHPVENVNGSVKRFKFFANQVNLQHINSGYCVAAAKFICAFLNYRFKSNRSMCLDMNSRSFLPNLKRAFLMRSDELRSSERAKNIIWPIIERYFTLLHDYRHITDWSKISKETVKNLKFPAVSFDVIPNDVYMNLESNHVYWFSYGNYSLKRCLSYLNTTEYEVAFFNCQLLKTENCLLFDEIVKGLNASRELRVIRCKIPSAHKPGHYNAQGYRCIIAYYPVIEYSSEDPSKFLMAGNQPGINLDKDDFYFQNCIRGYWCSCKAGLRTMGACSHIVTCLVAFGRPVDYKRARFLILDPLTYAQN